LGGEQPVPPFDAVGLGTATVDYVGLVPHFPEPDDKLPMVEFVRDGGGLVATALVTLARLGCRTRYVGKLGEDDFSAFILQGLEREGIDTRAVVRRPEVRGRFAFIMVEAGTGLRTILHSGHGPALLAPGELDRDTLLGGRVLLLDTSDAEASRTAAGWARETGIPVIFDADKYRPEARDLPALCSHPIASQRYAAAYTGESDPARAAHALAAELGRLVIVTAGRAGAYAAGPGIDLHQPAFPVPVKDTTGAGDVFHGAFAYALLQGWDLPRQLRFAAAAAALKCRGLGGREAIAGLDEVLPLAEGEC
jgi:sugar/nucleoside kinase (ribokinase family)